MTASRFISCRSAALAAVLVAFGAAPAAAQQPAAPPVEALVERALSRAPSLAARRERVRASQSAVLASDALPDPMIEVEYRSFNFPRYTIGSDPGSMAGVSFRQDLLNGGRRTTRRAVAEADTARRAAEQRVVAADIATEVRLQYARLYAIDRQEELLADAVQLAKMLEATVSSRYAAGSGDQASVLRVQLEQTRLVQRQADLATERTTVQVALDRLTDDAPETIIGRVAELPAPGLPAAVASLAEQAGQQAPEVALRQSELRSAARQVEAARAELKPSWSVGAGVFWQGGLDRMVNFSLGIELPLWKKRKQLPLIASAEGEKRAAELDVASAALDIRAQAVTLLAEYQNAIGQLERYRTGLLPQNTAALDAARASFLGGRGDFVSVLDEFRRWIDLRTEVVEREAARYSAQARLTALVAPPNGM